MCVVVSVPVTNSSTNHYDKAHMIRRHFNLSFLRRSSSGALPPTPAVWTLVASCRPGLHRPCVSFNFSGNYLCLSSVFDLLIPESHATFILDLSP